jgi:hypothetical protein
MSSRTLGTLVAEARTLLNDKIPTSGGAYRYTDGEIFEALNGFLAEVRYKRPDLFLTIGLRNPLPVYDAGLDMGLLFPLDIQAYQAGLYYVVGRCELREDTFSEDSRAVTLMNKSISQLTSVVS